MIVRLPLACFSMFVWVLFYATSFISLHFCLVYHLAQEGRREMTAWVRGSLLQGDHGVRIFSQFPPRQDEFERGFM